MLRITHNYLIQKLIDFTANIQNNAPGVATVKIKGIGNYSGSISQTYVTFYLKNCLCFNKKVVTSAVISWSAASKVSGYRGYRTALKTLMFI